MNSITRKISLVGTIVSWLLIFIYNILKLDVSGGYFEVNEVKIKTVLLIIPIICSLILGFSGMYGTTASSKSKSDTIIAIIIFIISVSFLYLMWAFKHIAIG